MRYAKFITTFIETNTYIAWDEMSNEGILVDPGEYRKPIVDGINKEAIDIKYIILTHGHPDHFCGTNEFKEVFPNAKIVASKAEAPMLEDPKLNNSFAMFGKVYSVVPDILVKEGDTLKLGDVTMKFIMTPGHSLGGMSVLIEDVLLSGDTLFRYSVGRTDLPMSNTADIIRSIKEKLFKLPDETLVLPGHGPETTIGDEKRGNPFV